MPEKISQEISEKILVAKISSAHGIKGQVKLLSLTENPRDVVKYKPIFDKNGKEFSLKIFGKSSGVKEGMLIVDVEGVCDRNQAETLRGTELFINKSQLKKNTSKDEFYYVDLVGLKVIGENSDEEIGKVINVMNYGAGDIIEIEFNKKSGQKEKEQMFTFRPEIFPEVDVKKGFIKIIFPEVVEISGSEADLIDELDD